VLEDERPWQRELSRLLRDAGYRVELADSYEKAVSFIEAKSVVVAIVDVSLVPGDGYDRKGIQFMEESGIPVVCVSGYLREEEVHDVLKNGKAEWFFPKQTFAGREQQFLDAVNYSMTVSRDELNARWEALESRIIGRRPN